MDKDNKEDKDEITSNLAKLFVHITSDAFEQTSKRAVMICFAVKYMLAIGIYIALRNFVGPQIGELWMALAFAYALYGQELYINVKVKERIVKSVLKDEIDKDEDEKDIEEEKP